MAEHLGDLTRTHTCGVLRPDDVGKSVVVLGWVHRIRDLGGVTFLDIRDRAGVSQVVERGICAMRRKPEMLVYIVLHILYGRSIFGESVKAYAVGDDFDREAAVDKIARNYLRFIEVYEGAPAPA